MHDRPRTAPAILALIGLTLACDVARGDGGTLRISQSSGDCTVSVFTAPTPLRAGSVDVSVLVQDSAGSRAVSNAVVYVRAAPLRGPGAVLRRRATAEQAVNKLFQVAELDLPSGGLWQFSIEVGEMSDSPSFTAEVAEPLPGWLALGPWIAWPWLVVALFGGNRLFRCRGTIVRSCGQVRAPGARR